jgi:regulatory protein
VPSARSTAIRLLTRRDYTTAELRRKLEDREFPAEEIDAAVASLTDQKLLDDRRAAGAHIRTASRVKRRGRLRIQRELEARGVDRGVIRELLDELSPDDEAAAIRQFLERRHPGRLSMVDRRKAFQQLLRRGFTSDAIAKVIRERLK